MQSPDIKKVIGARITLGLFMIGLFLGPITIAVLLAVWREWVGEQTPGAQA